MFPAIRRLIVQCTASLPDPTQRLVLWIVLALDDQLPKNLSQRDRTELTESTLDKRRAALVERWSHLHEALSKGNAELRPEGNRQKPPTARHLRRSGELTALAVLAKALLEAPGNGTAPSVRAGPPAQSIGKVVVVGSVAMDLTFRVHDFPPHETSTEASSFKVTPGGKGFMQAIAAARLGLNTALLATIADDEYQDLIIGQLQAARVDTSLIRIANKADNEYLEGEDNWSGTSFTGIFELPLGDSTAVNFRGHARITSQDINAASARIASCDALLVTFEIPTRIMQELLTMVAGLPPDRPQVIVTPGQPYVEGNKLARRVLTHVDYLVGRRWEFEQIFSKEHPTLPGDSLYKHLLSQGVKNVCVMNDHGSSVYRDMADVITENPPHHLYTMANSAISRDAFCAAIAHRLIEDPTGIGDSPGLAEAVRWATAAMAQAGSEFSKAVEAKDETPAFNSLPNRDDVNRRLETVNRVAKSPELAAENQRDDSRRPN
nr:PfkB family carbohydrate kinase [Kribbella italica]